MRITLYKNCKLSNRYNFVYDLTREDTGAGGYVSALTLYLSELQTTVIELPNTYYSRNMSFTFNINGDNRFKDAFAYNYCWVKTDDGLERYCFITSIDLGNTVATFHTEEDVWSSYALDMRLEYGYLTNAKQLNYKTGNNSSKIINYYLPPVAYQSNDEPIIKSAHAISGNFNIVLQLQTYKLGTGGDVTDRQVRTVILGTLEKINEAYVYQTTDFSTDEIFFILTYLQLYSGTQSLIPGQDLTNGKVDTFQYFQIDNITVVPKELNLGSVVDNKTLETLLTKTTGIFSLPINSTTDRFLAFFNFASLFYTSSEIKGRVKGIYYGVLSNNFKIISFGTRTGQYAIDMNGTSLKYSLRISATNWDFKLLLSFQQKLIDITNDFVLKVPFESLTGDVLAQRKIAKNTAIYNGVRSIAGGVADIAINAVTMNGGSSSSVRNTDYTYAFTKRNRPYVLSKKTTYKAKHESQGTPQGLVGGVFDISNGIVGIVNANTPQYTSNIGTFVSSEGMLNAAYGLCYQEVAPDNETYVNDMIETCGYTVYEILRGVDIIFNQNFSGEKNVLKFETAIISGGFPLDIKEQLESILENGFIIQY